MKPVVRAKFKVDSITIKPNWVKDAPHLSDIELSPVYDNDPNSENGKFYAATPGGKISLVTVNADAASAFEVGEEYFIDFSKVTKAEASH